MDNQLFFQRFPELLYIVTKHLTIWLENVLSSLDEDWWGSLVIPALSYQQKQRVDRLEIRQLEKLDLSALLRVVDKNWYPISNVKRFTIGDRNYVKEMQTIRNRWAHSDMHGFKVDDIYRDIDTLERFALLINIPKQETISIGEFKDSVLSMKLSAPVESQTQNKAEKSQESVKVKNDDNEIIEVGSIVTLESDPSKKGAVIEIEGDSEDTLCRVFIDGKIQPFYLSQLCKFRKEKARKTVSIDELHCLLTCLQIKHPSMFTLYSLNAARIDFVPYQFRPALKIIRSDQPRLLIADGVGVGKTIEAGLILRELQARGGVESVLIICPRPLVTERKWELEMKRFDERFTHLNGSALRSCIEETDLEGEWPEQHKKTIVPYSLFDEKSLYGNKTHRITQLGLLDLDSPPKFDLVIVDEAHHVRNSSTYAHQAVRLFCENAEAVVFLTATPVQVGSHDLYTLLNLLRPELVIDQETFHHMAGPNPYINQALSEARSGGENWHQRAHDILESAARTSWGSAMLQPNPVFQGIQKDLREDQITREERVAIVRKIEDLHSFSKLISRTRRRDIGNFCIRRPYTIEVDFTHEQKELHDRLLKFEAKSLSIMHGNRNVNFMISMIRRQAASCIFGLAPYLESLINRRISQLEWYESADEDMPDMDLFEELTEDAIAIIEAAENLPEYDPKFDKFLRIIREKETQQNNKVMVFSSFRHTLFYLKKRLEALDIRAGLIYGDIKDEERLILRRRFEGYADAVDSIDVMLFSEVGCEGLDYQFCDLMINYDLPWNPMRIEQRIGRIDRRGQKSEAVAIYNLITNETIDADIYERCLWRIGLFEESVGDCEEILGEIHKQIFNIANNLELNETERRDKLEQLADNQINRIHEQKALEDREYELFGIRLPKFEKDNEVRDSESFWLTPSSIQRFVSEYLEKRLGKGDFLLGEKALKTLRLSQEARNKLLHDFRSIQISRTPMSRTWEKWLKGSVQHCQVTFDSACAADNRDAHFIMPVHPVVLQAAHYLETPEPVFNSFQIHNHDLKPGEFQYAIYAWDYQGISRDIKLLPVSDNKDLGKNFLEYLESGVEITPGQQIPEDISFDHLDKIHHRLWDKEKNLHKTKTKEICDFRRESLKISYQGRQNVLSEQLANATDKKIIRMKQAQLRNIQAEFDRKISELDTAESLADIHARPVVFGLIRVEG